MTPRSPDSADHEDKQLGFDMAPLLPRKSKQAAELPFEPSHTQGVKAEEVLGVTSPESSASTSGLPGILCVSELTRRIMALLEDGIGAVWVEGEISNLRRQASGHSYFTLKDEFAQLACVLFARSAIGQKFALRDGLQVRLHGQISVYQPRGQYQLVVRMVQAKGEGVLQARFEELKCRLAAEGLFNQKRKRSLPRFPRRIGVVTSPSGAAIRDFLQVLHRRNPGLSVLVSPVRVQGKGAAAEIAAAIAELSLGSDAIGKVDVIVITRGGGSLEDLWEFNEEIVARAIASSTVPVVSAVGHEIDFSIADFVADLRAPTPSAAAELLASDAVELINRSVSLVARIARETEVSIERFRAQEHRLGSSPLFRDPLRRLNEARQTSDRLQENLESYLERRMENLSATIATAAAMIQLAQPSQRLIHSRQKFTLLEEQIQRLALHRLERESTRLSRLRATLSALSPEATLARGFSITKSSDGKVITASAQAKSGDHLLTHFAKGDVLSSVVDSVP